MKPEVVPDVLVRIFRAVAVIFLHLKRIALSQNPVMLIAQPFFFIALKGCGPFMIDEGVVAQDMDVSQHSAAVAEVVFLSVPSSKCGCVEWSHRLVGFLTDIHTETDGH